MWVDIIIAAAIALVTIIMGYLGVHVTLHPADSHRAKFWYKGGFVACAVAAVGLVVWQGIRNGTTQSKFASDVHDAKEEAASTKREAGKISQDLSAESARRERAEKDLRIALQQVGKSVSNQMKQTESVLSTNINTYRTDTTSAVSKLVRPGRDFTQDQRNRLVTALKDYHSRPN